MGACILTLCCIELTRMSDVDIINGSFPLVRFIQSKTYNVKHSSFTVDERPTHIYIYT